MTSEERLTAADPTNFLKTIYTVIDTSESAPDNQGAAIRDWDRAWREAGWRTRILLKPAEGLRIVKQIDRPSEK